MDQKNLVQEISVELNSQIHKATYYVERGYISGSIGGKRFSTPVTREPAEKTVRAMLLERIRRRRAERGDNR